MLLAIWVKSVVIDTLKRHFYNVKNSSLKYFVKIDVLTCLLLYDIPSLFKVHLITFFKFSIFFIILLNSIIGQMDKWLIDTFLAQCKFMRTGSYVALFEQVTFLIFQITTINEDPKSDIKFTFVNQQWLFDVLLQNKDVRCNSLG